MKLAFSLVMLLVLSCPSVASATVFTAAQAVITAKKVCAKFSSTGWKTQEFDDLSGFNMPGMKGKGWFVFGTLRHPAPHIDNVDVLVVVPKDGAPSGCDPLFH